MEKTAFFLHTKMAVFSMTRPYKLSDPSFLFRPSISKIILIYKECTFTFASIRVRAAKFFKLRFIFRFFFFLDH